MQPLKEDHITHPPNEGPTHPPNEEPPHPPKEPTPSLTKEEPPLVSSLRRVLLAISVIRDDIQYCQGMNLLAGWLLIVMMDEEKAFWTLAALLQYSFPESYFDATLSGVRIDEVSVAGESHR